MPRLIVHSPGGKTREIVLGDDEFTIGRTAGNDLNLDDVKVSRRHALVARFGDGWVLSDRGSSNHTWVNDNPIEKWNLDYGDRFRVGNTTIEFLASRSRGPSEKDDYAPTHEETMVRSAAEVAQFVIPPISPSKIQQVRSGAKPSKTSKGFKLGILFQVSRSLSEASGLDAMLETTMRLVFDVIRADNGGIFLGTGPDCLEPRIAWNRKKGGRISGEDVRFSGSVLRRVVTEDVSVIAQDAPNDPRFEHNQSIADMNIRSILCVPMWEPSGTSGAIYLDSKANRFAFSGDDLELLTAIANLVSIRVRQDELERKLKREEMLRDNLSRYHSADVVEMIIAKGGEVGLNVEEREVTVLFADVAGSTLMAERLGPAGTADLLNVFFQMATDAVFRHGGSVNKFMGDEVMAVYNAPLDQPEHAAKAVNSAVELALAVEEHNLSDPERAFNIHLGINTGPVVAGNVGTATRMEYTALGDTVNVAARLCKALPNNRVAIGRETFVQADGKADCQFKEVGSIPIQGRSKPIDCYEAVVSEPFD